MGENKYRVTGYVKLAKPKSTINDAEEKTVAVYARVSTAVENAAYAKIMKLQSRGNKNMEKQYTLKVYPKGMGRDAYRVFEICGKENLDSLCRLILDAFDFTDEHLYEFCMDGRMYSEYNYQSYPERDQLSTKVRIDKIGLEEKQKFMLHYDFGDDWAFIISVQKIMAIKEYSEPQIIKSKGEIEQYPDWDDEDGYNE